MNIYINNHCRYDIIIKIDSGETVLVYPQEVKPIARNNIDRIKILVRRNSKSAKKKNVYNLIIATEYVFSGVSDGTVFNVFGEKADVDFNACYDRLFLRVKDIMKISEKHKIMDEEEIKNVFRKSQKSDKTFDLFLNSIGPLIIFIIIGLFLTAKFGMKFAIIYFPLVLIIIVASVLFGFKLWDTIATKILKIGNDKTNFYKLFESEFINNYYSNHSRNK